MTEASTDMETTVHTSTKLWIWIKILKLNSNKKWRLLRKFKWGIPAITNGTEKAEADILLHFRFRFSQDIYDFDALKVN